MNYKELSLHSHALVVFDGLLKDPVFAGLQTKKNPDHGDPGVNENGEAGRRRKAGKCQQLKEKAEKTDANHCTASRILLY